MSDAPREDIEGLLRRALAPVEPPERLGERARTTLRGLSDLAADELESWELAAMRDPRNWVRPAAALAIGAGAGAGLAVLGWRQSQGSRARRAGRSLDRAVDQVGGAVRRRVRSR